MKKIFTLIIIAAIAITMLTGCNKGGTGTNGSPSPSPTLSFSVPWATNTPANTPAPSETASASASASSSASAQPLSADQAYVQFADAGVAACEGMAVKAGDNEDRNEALLLAQTMYQKIVALSTVEAIAGSDKITAFEGAGYSDFNVTKDGDSYTIKYTNPNKVAVKQTCVYDASANSMQTALYDSGGNKQLVLEFSLTSDGYAAQCYAKGDDGKYQTVTAFFNGTNFSSFGLIKASDTEPKSIYKNTSIATDFVKNGDIYCQLHGKTLILYDNGVTNTYTD